MIALTGKQRRTLRALGHHLDPVVQVGKSGVTDAVERKVAAELENHELIKLRVGSECPQTPDEAGGALSAACDAALVQVIGRTALLYRRRTKDPAIELS